MHRPTLRFRRLPVAAALCLAGCATVQSSPGAGGEAESRVAWVRDSVPLAAGALEEGEVATAPRIRLAVPPTHYATGRYVESAFLLSEDAYVLVVAVDLDRDVSVLYPETPERPTRAAASTTTRLPRFFAGLGTASRGGRYGPHYDGTYDFTQRISPLGGGIVLLAVASDRPLQLERLRGAAGNWDESALRELIFDQTVSSAVHAIGRAVVQPGQEFNTDYLSFNREGAATVRGLASSPTRPEGGSGSWERTIPQP